MVSRARVLRAVLVLSLALPAALLHGQSPGAPERPEPWPRERCARTFSDSGLRAARELRREEIPRFVGAVRRCPGLGDAALVSVISAVRGEPDTLTGAAWIRAATNVPSQRALDTLLGVFRDRGAPERLRAAAAGVLVYFLMARMSFSAEGLTEPDYRRGCPIRSTDRGRPAARRAKFSEGYERRIWDAAVQVQDDSASSKRMRYIAHCVAFSERLWQVTREK